MKTKRKMTLHSDKAMRKIEPKVDEYMIDGPVGIAKSKKEPTKVYPRLRLEHQFFPETKKWEVGKEYVVEMKVKMTGLSISKFQNDSEFDIVGFETDGKGEDGKEPVIPKP